MRSANPRGAGLDAGPAFAFARPVRHNLLMLPSPPIPPTPPPPPSPESRETHAGPEHDAGRCLVRRFTRGILAFGDRRADARFIIDGATGTPVLPVEPAASRCSELRFHLPAEADEVCQLLLTPAVIPRPEADEAVDRWAAYHGRSPSSVWVRCAIEAAKTADTVYDGAELTAPNPLRGLPEARLVKRLNAELPLVALACKRLTGLELAEPRVVGIDPLGFDIRARFGVVRMEFASPCRDEAGAWDAVRAELDAQPGPRSERGTDA